MSVPSNSSAKASDSANLATRTARCQPRSDAFSRFVLGMIVTIRPAFWARITGKKEFCKRTMPISVALRWASAAFGLTISNAPNKGSRRLFTMVSIRRSAFNRPVDASATELSSARSSGMAVATDVPIATASWLGWIPKYTR